MKKTAPRGFSRKGRGRKISSDLDEAVFSSKPGHRVVGSFIWKLLDGGYRGFKISKHSL